MRSETVERYLELLRSGGDDHPVTQMRKAGVDFTSDAPYRALVAKADRLESMSWYAGVLDMTLNTEMAHHLSSPLHR